MSGQKTTQISQDDLLDKTMSDAMLAIRKALRKTVIRHKLKIDMNGYGACEECSRVAYYNVPWPCKTIKDINEELK